jgi:hypothetical protein
MSTEQLIKKKKESMILGSIGGRCVFSSLSSHPPLFSSFPSLFLFIP